MDKIEEEFQPAKRNSEVMQTFGVRLRAQFNQNKAYRRPKELEWLEDLRQYKGLYDPDVKIDQDASHVYPKVTRSKVNTVLSRLHEMLFPENDRNFEIEPTPEPKLAKDTVMQIALSLIKPPPLDPQTQQPQVDPQTQQPAQPIPPTPEELERAIKYFAKARAEKMQSEIDDQLLEMRYPEENKKVLRSGLTYGTGVIAGPLVNRRTKRKWVPNHKTNEFEENTSSEDIPYMEFVRLWDWYPDMSVCEMDSSSGSFQRHVMTKHDLRQLMKRDDFYADVIKQFLTDHPNGNYSPEQWEVDLQAIEVEASTGSGSVKVQTALSSEQTTPVSYRQGGKRYEVLEFWGYVDGSDLAACGVTDLSGKPIDVSLEYTACVWLLGNLPIKAMIYDRALDHYKVFYYEKDETSIFGEGLGRVIRHSQIAVASSARMMLDNAACVAGPQVEVNWTLLHEGTDLNSFYPRKIWYRDGRGVEAQYPAIRVYNIDSHIVELGSIVDRFMNFGDIESCLPSWIISEPVNNENSKLTSGKQSSLTISIKDIVKNFDTFTEKIMSDLYAWNMEFNPREDIKGDFKCKPRGVSSLVMKEIRMAALANLKNTMQPEDWPYVPRREFLAETFKAHDININLRTEEEAQEFIASQRDERAQEFAYQQIEAEIAYKKAQATGQLTKAKKLNTEAEKDAKTPIEQPEGTDPNLLNAEVEGKNIDNTAKMEKMRREEEIHQQNLVQSSEKHQAGLLTGAAKTAMELKTKAATTEHGMKLKTYQAHQSAKQQKGGMGKK
jgi:hypothetical protein